MFLSPHSTRLVRTKKVTTNSAILTSKNDIFTSSMSTMSSDVKEHKTAAISQQGTSINTEETKTAVVPSSSKNKEQGEYKSTLSNTGQQIDKTTKESIESKNHKSFMTSTNLNNDMNTGNPEITGLEKGESTKTVTETDEEDKTIPVDDELQGQETTTKLPVTDFDVAESSKTSVQALVSSSSKVVDEEELERIEPEKSETESESIMTITDLTSLYKSIESSEYSETSKDEITETTINGRSGKFRQTLETSFTTLFKEHSTSESSKILQVTLESTTNIDTDQELSKNLLTTEPVTQEWVETNINSLKESGSMLTGKPVIEGELKDITEIVDNTSETNLKDILTNLAEKQTTDVQQGISVTTRVPNFQTEIQPYGENVTLGEEDLQHLFEGQSLIRIETPPLEASTPGIKFQRTDQILKKTNMEEKELQQITEGHRTMSTVTTELENMEQSTLEVDEVRESEGNQDYDMVTNTSIEEDQKILTDNVSEETKETSVPLEDEGKEADQENDKSSSVNTEETYLENFPETTGITTESGLMTELTDTDYTITISIAQTSKGEYSEDKAPESNTKLSITNKNEKIANILKTTKQSLKEGKSNENSDIFEQHLTTEDVKTESEIDESKTNLDDVAEILKYGSTKLSSEYPDDEASDTSIKLSVTDEKQELTINIFKTTTGSAEEEKSDYYSYIFEQPLITEHVKTESELDESKTKLGDVAETLKYGSTKSNSEYANGEASNTSTKVSVTGEKGELTTNIFKTATGSSKEGKSDYYSNILEQPLTTEHVKTESELDESKTKLGDIAETLKYGSTKSNSEYPNDEVFDTSTKLSVTGGKGELATNIFKTATGSSKEGKSDYYSNILEQPLTTEHLKTESELDESKTKLDDVAEILKYGSTKSNSEYPNDEASDTSTKVSVTGGKGELATNIFKTATGSSEEGQLDYYSNILEQPLTTEHLKTESELDESKTKLDDVAEILKYGSTKSNGEYSNDESSDTSTKVYVTSEKGELPTNIFKTATGSSKEGKSDYYSNIFEQPLTTEHVKTESELDESKTKLGDVAETLKYGSTKSNSEYPNGEASDTSTKVSVTGEKGEPTTNIFKTATGSSKEGKSDYYSNIFEQPLTTEHVKTESELDESKTKLGDVAETLKYGSTKSNSEYPNGEASDTSTKVSVTGEKGEPTTNIFKTATGSSKEGKSDYYSNIFEQPLTTEHVKTESELDESKIKLDDVAEILKYGSTNSNSKNPNDEASDASTKVSVTGEKGELTTNIFKTATGSSKKGKSDYYSNIFEQPPTAEHVKTESELDESKTKLDDVAEILKYGSTKSNSGYPEDEASVASPKLFVTAKNKELTKILKTTEGSLEEEEADRYSKISENYIITRESEITESITKLDEIAEILKYGKTTSTTEHPQDEASDASTKLFITGEKEELTKILKTTEKSLEGEQSGNYSKMFENVITTKHSQKGNEIDESVTELENITEILKQGKTDSGWKEKNTVAVGTITRHKETNKIKITVTKSYDKEKTSTEILKENMKPTLITEFEEQDVAEGILNNKDDKTEYYSTENEQELEKTSKELLTSEFALTKENAAVSKENAGPKNTIVLEKGKFTKRHEISKNSASTEYSEDESSKKSTSGEDRYIDTKTTNNEISLISLSHNHILDKEDLEHLFEGVKLAPSLEQMPTERPNYLNTSLNIYSIHSSLYQKGGTIKYNKSLYEYPEYEVETKPTEKDNSSSETNSKAYQEEIQDNISTQFKKFGDNRETESIEFKNVSTSAIGSKNTETATKERDKSSKTYSEISEDNTNTYEELYPHISAKLGKTIETESVVEFTNSSTSSIEGENTETTTEERDKSSKAYSEISEDNMSTNEELYPHISTKFGKAIETEPVLELRNSSTSSIEGENTETTTEERDKSSRVYSEISEDNTSTNEELYPHTSNKFSETIETEYQLEFRNSSTSSIEGENTKTTTEERDKSSKTYSEISEDNTSTNEELHPHISTKFGETIETESVVEFITSSNSNIEGEDTETTTEERNKSSKAYSEISEDNTSTNEELYPHISNKFSETIETEYQLEFRNSSTSSIEGENTKTTTEERNKSSKTYSEISEYNTSTNEKLYPNISTKFGKTIETESAAEFRNSSTSRIEGENTETNTAERDKSSKAYSEISEDNTSTNEELYPRISNKFSQTIETEYQLEIRNSSTSSIEGENTKTTTEERDKSSKTYSKISEDSTSTNEELYPHISTKFSQTIETESVAEFRNSSTSRIEGENTETTTEERDKSSKAYSEISEDNTSTNEELYPRISNKFSQTIETEYHLEIRNSSTSSIEGENTKTTTEERDKSSKTYSKISEDSTSTNEELYPHISTKFGKTIETESVVELRNSSTSSMEGENTYTSSEKRDKSSMAYSEISEDNTSTNEELYPHISNKFSQTIETEDQLEFRNSSTSSIEGENTKTTTEERDKSSKTYSEISEYNTSTNEKLYPHISIKFGKTIETESVAEFRNSSTSRIEGENTETTTEERDKSSKTYSEISEDNTSTNKKLYPHISTKFGETIETESVAEFRSSSTPKIEGENTETTTEERDKSSKTYSEISEDNTSTNKELYPHTSTQFGKTIETESIEFRNSSTYNVEGENIETTTEEIDKSSEAYSGTSEDHTSINKDIYPNISTLFDKTTETESTEFRYIFTSGIESENIQTTTEERHQSSEAYSDTSKDNTGGNTEMYNKKSTQFGKTIDTKSSIRRERTKTTPQEATKEVEESQTEETIKEEGSGIPDEKFKHTLKKEGSTTTDNRESDVQTFANVTEYHNYLFTETIRENKKIMASTTKESKASVMAEEEPTKKDEGVHDIGNTQSTLCEYCDSDKTSIHEGKISGKTSALDGSSAEGEDTTFGESSQEGVVPNKEHGENSTPGGGVGSTKEISTAENANETTEEGGETSVTSNNTSGETSLGNGSGEPSSSNKKSDTTQDTEGENDNTGSQESSESVNLEPDEKTKERGSKESVTPSNEVERTTAHEAGTAEIDEHSSSNNKESDKTALEGGKESEETTTRGASTEEANETVSSNKESDKTELPESGNESAETTIHEDDTEETDEATSLNKESDNTVLPEGGNESEETTRKASTKETDEATSSNKEYDKTALPEGGNESEETTPYKASTEEADEATSSNKEHDKTALPEGGNESEETTPHKASTEETDEATSSNKEYDETALPESGNESAETTIHEDDTEETDEATSLNKESDNTVLPEGGNESEETTRKASTKETDEATSSNKEYDKTALPEGGNESEETTPYKASTEEADEATSLKKEHDKTALPEGGNESEETTPHKASTEETDEATSSNKEYDKTALPEGGNESEETTPYKAGTEETDEATSLNKESDNTVLSAGGNESEETTPHKVGTEETDEVTSSNTKFDKTAVPEDKHDTLSVSIGGANNEPDETTTVEADIVDGEVTTLEGDNLSTSGNESETIKEVGNENSVTSNNDNDETSPEGGSQEPNTSNKDFGEHTTHEGGAKNLSNDVGDKNGESTSTETQSNGAGEISTISITSKIFTINSEITHFNEEVTKVSSNNKMEESSVHKKHTQVSTQIPEITSTTEIDVGMVDFESTPCEYCHSGVTAHYNERDETKTETIASFLSTENTAVEPEISEAENSSIMIDTTTESHEEVQEKEEEKETEKKTETKKEKEEEKEAEKKAEKEAEKEADKETNKHVEKADKKDEEGAGKEEGPEEGEDEEGEQETKPPKEEETETAREEEKETTAKEQEKEIESELEKKKEGEKEMTTKEQEKEIESEEEKKKEKEGEKETTTKEQEKEIENEKEKEKEKGTKGETETTTKEQEKEESEKEKEKEKEKERGKEKEKEGGKEKEAEGEKEMTTTEQEKEIENEEEKGKEGETETTTKEREKEIENEKEKEREREGEKEKEKEGEKETTTKEQEKAVENEKQKEKDGETETTTKEQEKEIKNEKEKANEKEGEKAKQETEETETKSSGTENLSTTEIDVDLVGFESTPCKYCHTGTEKELLHITEPELEKEETEKQTKGKTEEENKADEEKTTWKENKSKIEKEEGITEKIIKGTVANKPIVIIINNSGSKLEKLNRTILEKIINKPIQDVDLEYVDVDKGENESQSTITTKNEHLKLSIPYDTCKKADYVSGHNCFCNMQIYMSTLVQKINHKDSIKSKEDYCKDFLKLKHGLLIENSIKPVERKRRGLIYLENLKRKGENVEYETIDGLFETEYRLNSSDKNIFCLPGETVTIHCTAQKDEKGMSWKFRPHSSSKDELLLDKGGELVIHGVSVKNTGNYTCSKEGEENNSETQHWHELEMITFPIYDINMNIFYKFNDSCSLKTGDVLYTYLPKILGPLLCSNDNDLCTVDLERPRCLTRADDNFFNITIKTKISSDFVTTIHDKCDINCKLRVYENLVNVIYKNTVILEHVPVYSKLEPTHTIEFLPNIDGKEGSPVSVKPPKIMVFCPAGFGLESKRQSVCVACPSHTFSNDEEAYCKTCPGGQYQPEAGSKSCIQCNSPVDNEMCLRMLYTDTKLFKIYVGVAFGFVVLMVIIIIVWTSGYKDNSQTKDSYFEGSLRHRAIKRKDPDIETGVREPLLGRSPKRRTPPQLPPVDF